MFVSSMNFLAEGDYCKLEVKIDTNALGRPFRLWYRFPAAYKDFIDTNNGDPLLAALLLPAMRTGEPLEIKANVSPTLLQSTNKIQDIYRSWDPRLSRVAVEAPPRQSQSTRQHSQKGLFFSLGVDSFYSLLNNTRDHVADNNAITHLIVVYGFDIRVEKLNDDFFSKVLYNGTYVAREFKKTILPVTTNLRDFSDRFAKWGALYHGAALASVGLTLEDMFDRIYIAATHSYAKLLPWGSSPFLDPLWSTERLSIVHDGWKVTRLDKIRFISQYPIAMETLRVCFYADPLDNEYNCGRCEKCLRTMIGLHIAGALQKCKTLSHRIDVGLVRNIPIPRKTFVDELINSLGSSEEDLAIKSAIEQCISGRIDVKIRQRVTWLRRVLAIRMRRLIHALFESQKDRS